ncbi:MAG: hypothetical protein IJ189_03430 [Clostridia bacterium]|nr:hypothetical protein [Clostridia bacterium]
MIILPRLRRWMLGGVPVLLLTALAAPASVPGMLLLWMGLGTVILPRSLSPYARKKRPMLHRLFLAWAAGSCCFAALHAGWQVFFTPTDALSRALAQWGHCCLSLLTCERALAWPWSSKQSWIIGGLLSALMFFLLIVCT